VRLFCIYSQARQLASKARRKPRQRTRFAIYKTAQGLLICGEGNDEGKAAASQGRQAREGKQGKAGKGSKGSKASKEKIF